MARCTGAVGWLLLVLCVASAGRASAKTGKTINSFAGPYVAFAHAFYQCESNRDIQVFLRHSYYNPARPAEKQTITGNYTATIDLNDLLWARVRMDLRSNNQWKENAFVFNFPAGACSALREHIPSFFHVLFKLGPQAESSTTPCRVPADVHTVDREAVDWVFPKFPVMPYGHYRFNVMIGRGKIMHACVVADCSVVPKVI